MGTVIYSASPLQTILGMFGPVLFIFAIGVMGVGLAIVRKNQGRGARIGMGVAGAFLLIIGVIYGGITLVSLSSGTQTVTAHLNDKTIAVGNDGNGGTTTSYILEATAGQTSYDFVVSNSAYRKAQVNTCYQVDYFSRKSLFSAIPDTDLYHRVESVTRIVVADPSACP